MFLATLAFLAALVFDEALMLFVLLLMFFVLAIETPLEASLMEYRFVLKDDVPL